MHSELPPELKALSSFHGHLGPYVVVGYRMGQMARSELKGKIRAVVLTGLKPPVSCIVDGIQFSSGCTLGKGNISVKDEGMAKAIFTSYESVVEFDLKDSVKKDIDAQMTKETEEQLALSIFRAHAEDLFTFRRETTAPGRQ